MKFNKALKTKGMCPPPSRAFQRTLPAVLTGLILSGSVIAADVQIYGRIDNGLMYENVSQTGEKTSHNVSMESGIAGASLWGFKGTEKLGNGYSIALNLEGKLTTDDGAMGTAGQIFDRESHLQLNTPYGSFRLGRTGMLGGGVGGGLIAGQTNPFGVVYKTAGGQNVFQGAAQRVSNMVRYESPSMAGVKVYGQYSNATGLTTDFSEGDDTLRDSQRDRYAALGATYRNGGLRLALAVDWYLFNDAEDGAKGREDARNYSIAANYDFGSVKIYGGYQYADNMRTSVMGKNAQRGDGHVAMIGLGWDVGGGTLMTSAAFAHVGDFDYVEYGKTTTNEKKLEAWQVAAGYKYPFSKRTMIYGVLSYRDADLTHKQISSKGKVTDKSSETKTFQAMMGLQHKF